ncbi:uncharacterized protein LOC109707332 isoform X3 [Ananas comosus]|uniref:Uncharacterized protein LOC109707332 isoform X3 n=1 Tax=Ananas comosus TaxID=4615 RepID=A0A6P5ES30_ANACO|nr:uncharacterized protein LOC109707332 isoform X3 [Ananas comosus]
MCVDPNLQIIRPHIPAQVHANFGAHFPIPVKSHRWHGPYYTLCPPCLHTDPPTRLWAGPSHQPLMAGPALDVPRAESARHHVRALNTQFASWVQSQLQNHPDELWEDGVKDYLSHASHIMEKFKDVVDWLRQNAAKSGIPSVSGSHRDQNNVVTPSESNRVTFRPDVNNGLPKLTTPPSFSASQNTDSQKLVLFSSSQTPASIGSASDQNKFPKLTTPASFSALQKTDLQKSVLFSTSQTLASAGSLSDQKVEDKKPPLRLDVNNGFARQAIPTIFSFSSMQSSSSQSSVQFSDSQAPLFPGSQNSTAFSNAEASVDADEETDMEQPSSPSVKKTEEKGVYVVHEAKCKVYVKPDNPTEKGWKDMGLGHLSIKCKEDVKKATRESKPTILIRNDVGKALLNALLYPGIKMNIQKNTIASIFHTSGGGQPSEGEPGNATVVARTYLLRLKNEEETTKLAAAIKDNAPSD